MDQRSDHIRQNIETTRASLDEKIDTLEAKARETFDLKHQVSERPWMAMGAAVAAGFVLGNLGGGEEQRWHGQPATTTDYNQHAYNRATAAPEPLKSSGDHFLAQFDDEIELLKGAAISALTGFLHESIRTYVPAMGKHLQDASSRARGTPSTASSASYRTGAGRTDFDSPPATQGQSSQLSNPEAGGTGSYYPPGSPGAKNREYVRTFHAPQEAGRERAVGEEQTYWREAE